MSEKKYWEAISIKMRTRQKWKSVYSLIQENQGKLGTQIVLEERFTQESSVNEILPCNFFLVRIGIILESNLPQLFRYFCSRVGFRFGVGAIFVYEK